MSATISPPAASAVRRPRRRLRSAADEELVRLLRSGDAAAFEAIFDRHHRGILAFARHMVGSREEAEDVVQHTFIAAHRDLTGSAKPIQLKAWLYTIARNRCVSLLRARREERALEDVPEPSVEGLSSQVQRRQDLRDMVADLQHLPEDQRAALVLSELGALTHEEIAETLGVRKDKVKALVFQARESLAGSRTAREADCREIQEQLAVLRGGSLRRRTLRRHVEVCPSCAAFKAEVQRQRSAMALLLPVAPSLALKESVLAAVFGGGGAAWIGGGGASAGGGLLAAAGSKSLAAKVMTIAAVAGGATGGGLMAVDEIGSGTTEPDVALGATPSERKAVEMVGSLRERARKAAADRTADRFAGTAPAGGRRAAVARSIRSGRVTVVRAPKRSERARRRERAVARVPRPSEAIAAAPATEVARGGPKDGRGWRKETSPRDDRAAASRPERRHAGAGSPRRRPDASGTRRRLPAAATRARRREGGGAPGDAVRRAVRRSVRRLPRAGAPAAAREKAARPRTAHTDALPGARPAAPGKAPVEQPNAAGPTGDAEKAKDAVSTILGVLLRR